MYWMGNRRDAEQRNERLWRGWNATAIGCVKKTNA